MEEQAEKTEYLRETVVDLVDTNDKIKAWVEYLLGIHSIQ